MANPELLVVVLGLVATAAVVTSVIRTRNAQPATIKSAAADDGSFARLDDRIARLEQAIDVIAVETERVAENQRFLTKLLTELPSATNDSATA